MEKRPLKAHSGLGRIDARFMQKFTTSLKGHAILPDDRSYTRARRVWNHAVNVYPEIIVRCADVDDVVRAIEFSRRHELGIAVRSGGHSFAGHGVCDGGLVLDLSMMNRVEVDSDQLVARIEPGVRAGELDCLTQAFDLAVPLGSCPSVGVAGYSLGGGEGSPYSEAGLWLRQSEPR